MKKRLLVALFVMFILKTKAQQCTTPGTPVNVIGTPTGINSATLSWAAGNPTGSSLVTYYWAIGTSPEVTYGGSGLVAENTTTATTATTSALACGTTYYLSVLAQTSCNESNSAYGTSAAFKTTDCSSLSQILGIDIHDNTISSWSNIVAAGIKFSYIKATESTYPPYSNFLTNGNLAIAQKIVVGAYHFATPLFSPGYYQSDYNHEDTYGDEVANFVNAAYISHDFIGNGFLPPALDVEDQIVSFTPGNGLAYDVYVNILTGSSYYLNAFGIVVPLPSKPAMGAAALAQWIQGWTTEVYAETHVMPVIYCGKSYASALYPYYQSGLISSKLWISDISDPIGNPSTGEWPWLFDQYSRSGSIPKGISGNVDLDIFNGDMTAFDNLIGDNNSLPDLIVQNPQVTPSSVYEGESVTASCTNLNQGLGNAAASYTAVWLSADQVFDGSPTDTYLEEIPIPALSPNQASSQLSTPITIPLGPYAGTWYIMFGANATGSVKETNTGNNQIFIPITFCTPPATRVVSGPNEICEGSTVDAELSVPTCTGCSYNWSSGDQGSSILVLPFGTTTYTVTTSNSCGSALSTFTLHVGPLPAGPITGNNTDPIQYGISYNFSVSPVYNSSYNWQTIQGNGANVNLVTGNPYTDIIWSQTNASTDLVAVVPIDSLCGEGTPSNVTITFPKALAVDLMSFDIRKKNNNNLLTWQTSLTENVVNFLIERSSDGSYFYGIGSAPENNQAQYSFIDSLPLTRINYYRLKMIDKNGLYSYSDVKTIINNLIGFTASIFPNPVQNNLLLNIISNKTMNMQIEIVDNEGKIITSNQVQVAAGVSTQTISTTSLSNGFYYIKCLNPDGETKLKFIKNR